jgi:hypothetical protein
MVQARPSRLGAAMTVLVAVVFLLVLGDLGLAATLAARNGSVQLAPAAAQSTPKVKSPAQTKTGHPCNHGYYVSQAAHSKKGGAYVSAIAKSDLGKDGNCSAPLPATPPAAKPKPSTS